MTILLILLFIYILYRIVGIKNLVKRIVLLEKRVKKLEKDVGMLRLYGDDN